MSWVCVSDSRNVARMARGGEPVAHNSRNCAPALTAGTIMGARFASYQQDDLELLRDGLFECAVETCIGAGQIAIVQVNADIGNRAAAFDAAVPMAV